MDIDEKDELKVVLALGLMAAIGILFQLKGSHISIVSWSAPSPAMSVWMTYTKGAVLGIFGMYVALLTLSLSVEYINGAEGIAEKIRFGSDIFFTVGGLALFLLLMTYLVRGVSQW